MATASGARADEVARSFLVVSRKVGESVRVGKGVQIVLIGVEGHQVKIGIEAPREVAVVRGEALAKRNPAG